MTLGYTLDIKNPTIYFKKCCYYLTLYHDY